MQVPSGADSSLDTPSLSLVQQGIESALSLAGVGVSEYLVPEGLFSCSDGIYQLVGVDPAAGRQILDFWPDRVHPDDRPRQKNAYSDFIQGVASTYEETYRVWHDGGHWISVLSRARWVSRSDGKPGRCVLGYVIDVTARSEDLDRLRAREERFRMSVSALDGIVYDLDLRTQRSERHGLQRMLGYAELEGSDGYAGWLSVVHPDDLGRFTAKVRECRSSGRSYEVTYRVRHQDGCWRHVRQRGTYLLGHDGKPIRAYGVIEDITDAETQREQLQMQAAIIERMSEGVMLVDRNGTIVSANPALEKMFGYESGEMRGLNAAVMSFRSAQEFDGLMRSVFAGTENDKTSIIDLEGRRRDNSMCVVQGCFSSMHLGARRCVIAVLTDITERKQLERELMQVATRVQHRIGGDLHEGLGQQLAGIAMMLQGLGQRAGIAGINSLRAEVDAIVNLINSAVRSTRTLARGLSPVRSSPRGLMEGFEELVHQVHERYRIRVQLTVDVPPVLPLDEHAAINLFHIAQEAVQNAARHADAERISLRLQVTDTDLELLVMDDGRGFDPLEGSRSGTGLRIMRFRAQLVGGYLAVESRPGAGTTLRCRCPVKQSKEVA